MKTIEQKKMEFLTMGKIAERAEEMDLLFFDRLSFIMDVQLVHEAVGLNLEDFLNADDFNFTHDVMGIQNNVNRQTKTLENHFLPRYSI